MAVYKIDSKKVLKSDGLVYLYLSKLETGQRQPDLKSMKVKIPLKFWNQTKQKVSKELPDKWLGKFKSVDQLNKWLTEQIQNFIKVNGNFDFIPSEEKTVNDWFKKIIERTTNQGTKTRYENVYMLMEKFQKYYTVNNLKKMESTLVFFKSLNVDWVEAFRKWLIRVNNNENNSSNFKVKALGGIVRKAHNERWYHLEVNPFDFIKLKYEETNVEILNFDELKSFMTTKFIEVSRRKNTGIPNEILWKTPIKENIKLRNERYKKRNEGHHSLNDIRNYFLFQLFSQGIRVSDLITLRWNDFRVEESGLRIYKKMFKTKMYVNILVNDKMTDIISIYIIRYKELLENEIILLNKLVSDIDKCDSDIYFMDKTTIDDKLYTVTSNWCEEINDGNGSGFYLGVPDLKLIENTKRFGFDKDDIINLGLIEGWLTNQISISKEKLRVEKFKLVCSMITKLSTHKKVKTEFVFNLMRNYYFDDIDESNDFGYITEDQYRKFQSARTVYNGLLKILAFQSGIEKNLTSHIARHSYTSLMLELGENVNLFDIMTSLGHKHLTTTQSYIQRFTHKSVDKLNMIISNRLDK